MKLSDFVKVAEMIDIIIKGYVNDLELMPPLLAISVGR